MTSRLQTTTDLPRPAALRPGALRGPALLLTVTLLATLGAGCLGTSAPTESRQHLEWDVELRWTPTAEQRAAGTGFAVLFVPAPLLDGVTPSTPLKGDRELPAGAPGAGWVRVDEAWAPSDNGSPAARLVAVEGVTHYRWSHTGRWMVDDGGEVDWPTVTVSLAAEARTSPISDPPEGVLYRAYSTADGVEVSWDMQSSSQITCPDRSSPATSSGDGETGEGTLGMGEGTLTLTRPPGSAAILDCSRAF